MTNDNKSTGVQPEVLAGLAAAARVSVVKKASSKMIGSGTPNIHNKIPRRKPPPRSWLAAVEHGNSQMPGFSQRTRMRRDGSQFAFSQGVAGRSSAQQLLHSSVELSRR
jgi:hypothetical protein